MFKTKLKICGITDLKQALALSDLKVDFLGFNFFKQSPRYISPEKANNIIERLSGQVKTVGILVKPTLEECLNLLSQVRLDFLQIYQPQDFKDFNRLPVKVISAHRLRSAANFKMPEKGETYVLLDVFHSHAFGGTGKQFDWTTIPKSLDRQRLILAGGITPANIARALKLVKPAVIDVASGVEVAPGIKDLKKVEALIETMRQVQNNWMEALNGNL